VKHVRPGWLEFLIKAWTVSVTQVMDAGRVAERVTLGALFVGLLKVSLLGFAVGSSGAAHCRRTTTVGRRPGVRRNLDPMPFMPGPNIVGITTCVGSNLRGAGTAVSGFILIPWTVGLSLGGLYLRFARLAGLQNIFGGLSAAAAGPVIATGIRLLMPHRNRRTALLFAALAFAGMAFTKLSLLVVLLGLAPISIAVAGIASMRAS
jgi:chromate transporter